ncbi:MULTISPECIES: histidine phosphatase family protein [Citrobacter freundii complex]|jgi:2,3-bisphosphoglycerate-dependent phosphoglycerate mutase
MGKIILLRHGESQCNQQNRFTGWEDVPLTPKGVEEARRAANHVAGQSC